jgi:hypothetical protein
MEADRALDPACAEREIAGRSAVEPETAILFADGGRQPSAGAWRERWTLRRCGALHTVNLHFLAGPEGIAVDIGVPGATLTRPAVQQGAVAVLDSFVPDLLEACERVRVVDSRVLEPPADGQATAWTERWTVEGCGRRDGLTIRFRPDQAPSLFQILGG